ncbi:MAG TPA: leucine--tRNA ligase [Candidatus Paceibacterota bacterium]|nr:leucine--tRNA ligase [Candidatus Paceibacterota bacterium]
MHKKFDHISIEQKWQKQWKEQRIYDVGTRDKKREKEYILVEWPYPSGNLHIGHWHAFAVVDIYARAARMKGKQVLFPIGFDAFGLPAENAAIKHGKNPDIWTTENITYMTKQLESMGNSFSWDKTTQSTDPEYYKWTQWMFTQFFENDIAYRGTAMVNWCPGCNTVIANEQVHNGLCERSGDEIIRKEMPQWMLRITQFADALIDDLDTLTEWPEYIKEAQRQWIGRSRGAEIDFPLSTGDSVTVFTTRPDTLYGTTYLVLAPEHDLVQKHKASIKNWDAVDAYIRATATKDDVTRTKNEKEKTGVCLIGITAVNPANGESIPVYIADYVLKAYGTGAIMAVPAHDERDFAFAKKYNINIISVIDSETIDELPTTRVGVLKNSGPYDGMHSEQAKKAIAEHVGGRLTNTYRLRDWSIGRQRYWGVPIPIVYSPEGVPHSIPREHLPWHLPTDVDFTPTGEPPLAKSSELKERTERIFGEGWTPEVETMDTFVDSSWYYLRYLDTHNNETFCTQENQDAWLPIDVYFGGSEHTTMHLLYSRFWHKALYSLGLVAETEPYRKRVNRGLVLGPDGNKMSKSKGNVIDPDAQVTLLGADTVKMFLAFMGPYGEPGSYPWDVGGIAGIRRFLERVNGLHEHKISTQENTETTQLLQKTIQKVTSDIMLYKFNTAISALMIFVNHAEQHGLSHDSYQTFLRMLAPFAPHLAEELWSNEGNITSIHNELLPVADVTKIITKRTTIGVQINGKMRGTVEVDTDAPEEVVFATVTQDSLLNSRLTGEVRRVVFVPNKIINIIVQ